MDAHDETSLPESADVVVIGGGIAGSATTYFLAKRGLSVVLCEKGRIAGEQSGRNWGWVRQQGRDPAEMPMIMDSLRIWRGLKEETGEDLGYHQGGSLYLARDQAELEVHAKWLSTAEQYQLDTRIIDGRELCRLLEGADGGYHLWMEHLSELVETGSSAPIAESDAQPYETRYRDIVTAA